MGTKLIKVHFASSRPNVRHRYENGPWQDSNVFLVQSGQPTYTFHAEDSRACKSQITLSEDEIEFPLGSNVLTIEKLVTDGSGSDLNEKFRFKVEHPSITLTNVLASVNEPVTITGLPDGNFIITEQIAPSGYISDPTPQTVSLGPAAPIKSVSFTNTKDETPVPTGDGTLTVKKKVINEEPTDRDRVFTINLIGPIIRYGIQFSINSPALVENLPDGAYKAEEVGVPAFYNHHGISPESFVILGGSNHSVEAINSTGSGDDDDDFFGDGQITISKKLFDIDDIEITNSNELFTVSLKVGDLIIPGLKFSVNTPLILKNVPFGIYELYEEKTFGYDQISVVPFPLSLSEASTAGEFVVTNYMAIPPIDFDDKVFYTVSSNPGVLRRHTLTEALEVSTTHSYTFPTDAEVPGIESLFQNTGPTQYVAVLRNGDVLVHASMDTSSWDGLWLFNEFCVLKKFIQITKSTATSSMTNVITVDEEDNVYVPFLSASGAGRVIIKYNPDLETILWTSAGTGHGFTLVNTNVTSRFVILIHINSTNFILDWHDKATGETIKQETFGGFSNLTSTIFFENLLEHKFFISYSWNTSPVQHVFMIYDVDGNLIREIADIPEITLAYLGARIKAAGQNRDGSLQVTFDNNKQLFLSKDFEYLYHLTTGIRGNAKAGWDIDPNKAYMLQFDNSFGITTFHINDLINQTVSAASTGVSANVRSSTAFGMKPENWPVLPAPPPPPPPVGDAVININKVINGGDPADDDELFYVNIFAQYSHSSYLFQGIPFSVNSPGSISVPTGIYTVQEPQLNANFDHVSTTPPSFIITDNETVNVVITNEKRDTPRESGWIRAFKSITNEQAGDRNLWFYYDLINTGAGPSYTNKPCSPGGIVTELVEYGTYNIVERTDLNPPGFENVSITPSSPITISGDHADVGDSLNILFTNERTGKFCAGTMRVDEVFFGSSFSTKADAFFDIELTDFWPPSAGTNRLEISLDGTSLAGSYDYGDGDTEETIVDGIVASLNTVFSSYPITAIKKNAFSFIIQANVPGSAGNSNCFKATYSEHIMIDSEQSGTYYTCMAGGKDGDSPTMTIQYPNLLSAPSVPVIWEAVDTPAQVATKIANAVNAKTEINISASASGNVVTFTEKRPDEVHCGKVVKVYYSTNTIKITPADGRIVLG